MKQYFIFEDLWNVVKLNDKSFFADNLESLDSFYQAKNDVKTQYWIFINIDIDDQKRTANLKSIKIIYEILTNKYQK